MGLNKNDPPPHNVKCTSALKNKCEFRNLPFIPNAFPPLPPTLPSTIHAHLIRFQEIDLGTITMWVHVTPFFFI